MIANCGVAGSNTDKLTQILCDEKLDFIIGEVEIQLGFLHLSKKQLAKEIFKTTPHNIILHPLVFSYKLTR